MSRTDKIIIWLDDARDPADSRWKDLVQRPDNSILVWIKSFEEFVWWIEANGLPDYVCFDHDINSDTFNGVDAAKYLTGYCMSKDLPLPPYSIHSANTVGRENIRSVLESFKKVCPKIPENEIVFQTLLARSKRMD